MGNISITTDSALNFFGFDSEAGGYSFTIRYLILIKLIRRRKKKKKQIGTHIIYLYYILFRVTRKYESYGYVATRERKQGAFRVG